MEEQKGGESQLEAISTMTVTSPTFGKHEPSLEAFSSVTKLSALIHDIIPLALNNKNEGVVGISKNFGTMTPMS